jgi:hypothetical protein
MADELISMFSSMGTSDKETLIVQFGRIMKCEENVSKFFLESSDWNVEKAVNTYLTTMGAGGGAGMNMRMQAPRAAFDSESTIPQGAKVPAGTTVRVNWRFKNVGTIPWPIDAKLIHVDGQHFGFNENVSVRAAPGEVVNFPIEFTMPKVPGDYYGQWRMTCSTGFFVDPVYVIVSVVGDQSTTSTNNSMIQTSKTSEEDSMMMET